VASVRRGALLLASVQVAVIGVLAAAGALGAAAAAAAVAYGAACDLLALRGLRRAGATSVGLANAVTWTRGALTGGAAGLAVQEYPGARVAGVLVACAALALALDAVDGRLARWTRTATPFGGRFDMEVDASLILVLSVAAVPVLGPWVLLVGAARYLLLGAELALPRLRRAVPTTRWRKAVAGVQGAVLVVVCARVLPIEAAEALAGVSASALAVSFGTQLWWVTREGRRPARAGVPEVASVPAP
jgi:phosphatidylglycerophosphate synthase